MGYYYKSSLFTFFTKSTHAGIGDYNMQFFCLIDGVLVTVSNNSSKQPIAICSSSSHVGCLLLSVKMQLLLAANLAHLAKSFLGRKHLTHICWPNPCTIVVALCGYCLWYFSCAEADSHMVVSDLKWITFCLYIINHRILLSLFSNRTLLDLRSLWRIPASINMIKCLYDIFQNT